MARKVIEKVMCDACAESETETDATVVLSIGEDAYDLCGPHGDKFREYFRDLFKKAQQSRGEGRPAAGEDARPSVVITGNIPGYPASVAREAVERQGYRIAGHVDADTKLIIFGERPAPHKIKEAKEHGTPVLDASKPKVFARCVSAGEFTPSGTLPKVSSKITAADVRSLSA
ncbi:hypothetical protein [Streptomyces alfalfae]|uniref:hypothetical protein n=1 Tax=Streptomyces alfalfae TaxID=1642299 RepID=UPI001BA4527B|nr:hypothetical protein [Streptomyces alfalfae]